MTKAYSDIVSQKGFNHNLVDKKWQKAWEEKSTYTPEISKSKGKYYNLWMFPYPSAEGVHVGTIFSSTGGDVFGRFQRMQGHAVFQPMGYDSFGIHSENYAIKIGENPKKFVARAIKNYERQFKQIGHGYDWTRSVTTSDKDYYRWTQWLFSQMFKSGLAYKKSASVNWCPGCKTVLADEQIMTPSQAGKLPLGFDKIEDVPEGTRVCERCGSIPERKELSQWFFRITKYADRLLANLDKIDWTEKVKIAQREWIGKKNGINISYPIKGTKSKVVCFTTRPDTNFGATFLVVAPEYAQKYLLKIVPAKHKMVLSKYIEVSLNKSEQQRKEEGRKKTGEFTGLYAINQLNNYEMPIWVSDFVLMDFGTGAVVGVPGHDKRDFEFAKEYSIPVKRVVEGKDGDKSKITSINQVQEDEGKMLNSEFLNGLDIHQATSEMMAYLEKMSWGEKETTYHLRDWLISRQRFWGPPIPMIYCESCASNSKSWFDLPESKFLLNSDQSDWDPAGWYPEDNLPVELPDIDDYAPKGNGEGPLANHPEFFKVRCPQCGSQAKRETDVSDTFVDSSWYFLRYPSVDAETANKLPFDPEITRNWLPVNLYFGGAEHSVLHLMYARFVTMFLCDLKLIGFEEPFPKFYAHGLMIKDGAKMSKSRGNVVNPDDYVEKFGADTLRLYLVFMGPMDGYPDFRDTGIEGMRRFVDRVWDLFVNFKDIDLTREDEAKIEAKMHKTIKDVTGDIQEFKYNTAISTIMEYVNLLRDTASKKSKGKSSYNAFWESCLVTLVQLLAPFAPHLAEEVWVSVLGRDFSVHTSTWPNYLEEKTVDEQAVVAVQVDGKLRATVNLTKKEALDEEHVVEVVKKEENVSKWLTKLPKKVVFVPGKLVNFVLD